MTNTFDPISTRFNKLVHREMKHVLAPRLRELEEVDPAAATEVEFHSRATIDSEPRTSRVDGNIAAAMLAPALGLLALSLLHLFVPVIDGLGLRWLFYENGVSNLTIVLTLGAWLLSWVMLYEAWHGRVVSRAKLYGVTGGTVLVALILLAPFVYRLLET